MAFVSFAPNFEDVMLWRALHSVGRGVYVDIGAGDPDAGSVTRAFADRGWTGVNVAADAAAFRKLVAHRPRDVTLRPQSGVDAALAELPGDIHFLRVDLAGDEARVLRAVDFARVRPWIVLARAVSVPDWEPALRDAGYGFVWFDGVSRFHVAEERMLALAPHFAAPPNASDDFVREVDPAMVERIAAAEARSVLLAEQLEAAEKRSREDVRAMMQARVLSEHRVQQILSADQQTRIMEQHARAVERVLAAETQRADAAAMWLQAMRASSSWRVTAPLRRLLSRRAAPEPEPVLAATPPPEQPPAPAPIVDLTQPPALPRAPSGRRVHRAVHQYHPGTARGDAITHSMLLIRRLLRQLGYASEIYCEHLAEDLDEGLRHSSLLPLHADYVLLAHFSLGFDDFERIATLPAAKVLMYHNITPPALLAQSPVLQHYAELGQRQLAQWRPHVSAALADSEYNAIDLRRLGFETVQSCPLLFDIEAMRVAAALPVEPRRDPRFTVLFVGRLVGSKAQDELVEAFALFHAALGRPSRLVLVGHAASGDAYLAALSDRIAALELRNAVEITGFVDEAGLRQCYSEADLYVSLSHHEGFGVPLIEAMAHGVPVLAWPCGAVPYTMGAAGELLTDRSPQAVAERMLALAEPSEARLRMLRLQGRELDRFRLERHLPHLLAALARAGAAHPQDPATRAQLQAAMRFTVAGHINGSYSLAAVNRGLARSIERIRPGQMRIVAVEGSETDDLSRVPDHERAGIAALAARPPAATGPRVVISQHYPVHVPADPADLKLALFFWEESVIPIATIRGLNRDFRGVLAPSSYVAKVLVDSGATIPVHMVGQSPELDAFRRIGQERALAASGPTRFLHVSSCLPRKGVDVLLAAYVRAFRKTDAVRLVIKGYPNPHNTVPAQVEAIRAADPGAPEIVLINDDLDRESFLDLYRQADVMVLPTRGEGFNLPAAEAMAARLRLIVTGQGGQSDFCTPATARLLESRPVASASHLASGNSLWLEPSEDDLVAALREAHAQAHAQPADTRAAAAMIDSMNDASLVRRIVDAATDCLMLAPSPPPRIAWITTWDVRCGVAEYARHLLSCWPEQALADTVVLACSRTTVDREALPRVRIGWRLTGEANAEILATVVAQEDPQIVVIQHQPGLMDWPELARLVRSPEMAGRTITVTLHNTGHLAEIAGRERREILDALARVARVIVHTTDDLQRLGGWGLSDRLVMMPHGVPAGRIPGPQRTLDHSSAPIIGCYGFFLPGKGIPQLIAAMRTLRRHWPGLRLRLVNAEYGIADSAREIALCRDAAAASGLQDAIDFHTDFLPEAESRALLAGCDLVVLPYQTSREASSAALRSVLGVGVPVVVTPLAVFDDAAGAVARLAGTDPEAIAEGVHALLSDAALRHDLQERADAWTEAHGWPAIAERMHLMLLGLMQETRLRHVTK